MRHTFARCKKNPGGSSRTSVEPRKRSGFVQTARSAFLSCVFEFFTNGHRCGCCPLCKDYETCHLALRLTMYFMKSLNSSWSSRGVSKETGHSLVDGAFIYTIVFYILRKMFNTLFYCRHLLHIVIQAVLNRCVFLGYFNKNAWSSQIFIEIHTARLWHFETMERSII